MNEHALRVLEFHEALASVASRAGSSMGREALLRFRPRAERKDAVRELERVEETSRLLASKPEWAPPDVPDARRALRVLEVEGGVLEGSELWTLGLLLESSRLLSSALARAFSEASPGEGGAEGAHGFPLLARLRELLHHDESEEERIRRTVDEEGEVRDRASPALAAVRQKLRRARARIVRRLEEFLGTLPERWVVPDASVSVRDGRFVIPVRREAKAEVGGAVHGESASGATLFVEPPIAIGLMNELRELEREEAREIQRILREATHRLASVRDPLRGSLEALIDFDTLWARARTARAWDGRPPTLVPPGDGAIVLADARHPLLLEQMGAEHVVPYHLELGAGERVMVVSGPNTGGKTVFLKGVGLLVALAESGIVPPAGDGTRIPFFREVFTDIGDEQSIAESLSTFSAHLQNQREIVEQAGPDSLVLMDEMGTGTDPAEGAALARAVLEALVERRAVAFATSHLGALKRLDRPGSGIVNASLQFDPDRIAPTYVLRKGRPGRSYGLAIARRLGFPASVLDRAEEHLGGKELSVEELLEALERKEKEARELVEGLERKEQEVERLRTELARREEELRERERTAERRAREDARRLLLEAREEVERAIQDVRSGGEGELEDTARRARRRVEEAARRQSEEAPEPAERGGPAPQLTSGDRVRVRGSGARGIVTEVRDDRVLVEASGLRLQVPASELEVVERGERERPGAERTPAKGGWSGPAVDASPESDLRGLRIDEVDAVLHRALDRAILGDLPELRVIHGKGTGALRGRVRELLEADPRVLEFRAGEPGEGGAGVTVVKLR